MVHLALIKDEFRLDLGSELRIDKMTFVSIENGIFFGEKQLIFCYDFNVSHELSVNLTTCI